MNILINAPFSPDNRKLIVSAAADRNFLKSGEIEAADIIIGDIPEEYYGQLDRLRWLQLTSAGADKIIYGNAVKDGVVITNASGAFGEVIAEYVIGGILCLYRDLFSYRKNQSGRIWRDTQKERMIFGSRALILGCGNIGQCVSQLLRAFGAFTVGVRRTDKPNAAFDKTYTVDALDDLLPTADMVICALPKTPETEHLLNARRLSVMKRDALLVNVGRGSVIDTEALTGQLENKRLYGAVLDVFEQEPLCESSPLWNMDNVLITPHISGQSFGHSARTESLIADICAENLRRFISGEPLKNIVSRDISSV